MQIEQVNPNKPKFGLVVAMACVALIVIFIAAAIILGWRSHKKNTAPFTKHPVSRLVSPMRTGLTEARDSAV